MDKRTIGIIGCGAIGNALLKFVHTELGERTGKVLIFDIDRRKAEESARHHSLAEVCPGIKETAAGSDILVEAASPACVRDVFSACLSSRTDIMFMSVGGLLGKEDLLSEARVKGIKTILPSGAVCGIDALKAMKNAGIDEVRLTTRKPARALKGAPYLSEKGIVPDEIDAETVIFSGNAREAVRAFPRNINVSALISLAGTGAENTLVRIIVSPDFTSNSHELEVKGKAGSFRTVTWNVPSPDNPGTSYLAALSAMTALKEYFESVRMGS